MYEVNQRGLVSELDHIPVSSHICEKSSHVVIVAGLVTC